MSSAIRIDKDGVWYYNDVEMIRKDIVLLFSSNLTRDASGRYHIEYNKERCPVDVEDTPFVVRNASLTQDGGSTHFVIVLSDESVEELDLRSLAISEANILYCSVKNRKFSARFSRPAYYQMAEYIEYDSAGDTYFIAANGRCYPIGPVPARA